MAAFNQLKYQTTQYLKKKMLLANIFRIFLDEFKFNIEYYYMNKKKLYEPEK